MGKVLKELIQYNGIDDCIYNNLINFKQFSIEKILCLSLEKPDIEQITKVWVSYKILDYELLKTPIGVSCENQILTGNKVFISAELYVKVEYVANKCSQSVHSMYTTIPICEYVTLQSDFNGCSSICPSISIEDIYCEQQECRDFYLSIVLMAIADIC